MAMKSPAMYAAGGGGQTFGAERFEKELLEHRPAAARSAAHRRLVMLLGDACESYLRGLAETDRSLTRQITELLTLARHNICEGRKKLTPTRVHRVLRIREPIRSERNHQFRFHKENTNHDHGT
jgi:hypothetical protein